MQLFLIGPTLSFYRSRGRRDDGGFVLPLVVIIALILLVGGLATLPGPHRRSPQQAMALSADQLLLRQLCRASQLQRHLDQSSPAIGHLPRSADSTPSVDGQLSYSPPEAACKDSTPAPATQLLCDRSATLPSQSSVTSQAVPGISIQRTISVDPDDGDVLLVRYATNNSILVNVKQNTALGPPAQGWCP